MDGQVLRMVVLTSGGTALRTGGGDVVVCWNRYSVGLRDDEACLFRDVSGRKTSPDRRIGQHHCSACKTLHCLLFSWLELKCKR